MENGKGITLAQLRMLIMFCFSYYGPHYYATQLHYNYEPEVVAS